MITRGLLQDVKPLVRRIKSVLFGAIHLTTGLGLHQVIPNIGLGLACGFLRHRLGLISAHMTNNAAITAENAYGSPSILHNNALDVII